MHAELLINADWIVPVAQPGWLEKHSLAVSEGRVVALLPTAEADTQVEADHTLELPGHALMPGLINAHTHAPMVLFRGFGDSSLDFELRVHLYDVDRRLSTISNLNFAIDRAFREEGIQIPFPQRDVHLYQEATD